MGLDTGAAGLWADPSLTDPARVMRPAGSVAYAKPKKPRRIDEAVTVLPGSDLPYEATQIEAAF